MKPLISKDEKSTDLSLKKENNIAPNTPQPSDSYDRNN